MLGLGVVEGFFGPEWSWESRHHFCEHLRVCGGEFYIYAPKRDSYLRKNWDENHPKEIWNELKNLSDKCHQKNVAFGIGLSPFEIHTNWNHQSKSKLRDKVDRLGELDFKYLGLFFDDMKGSADLADKQVEIVEFVKSLTNKTILFCPTYYSHDPILDKVFGQRAIDYLAKIGNLSRGIQIFWTGSKVISKSISASELEEIGAVLKRKPIIWDNYFANDGPKQCKFLKLKPLEGRTEEALKRSSGWAFNLMNQPRLSEILFSSSVGTIRDKKNPKHSFEEALSKADDAEALLNCSAQFEKLGLDGIDEKTKVEMAARFSFNGASGEIRDWLSNRYLVGDECLTD